MAYQLYYAVIDFIRLRTDFGEYFKTEQFKSTRIYTLSQFPRQNLIKKLAIILFAIFLADDIEFAFLFFLFYRHKEEIKIWTKLITHT